MAAKQAGGGSHPNEPTKAVVVGLAVMDTIFRIPKMPESEQSVQVDSFSLHPGGKGLVQAVAAVRLGMQVELVASIGNDAFAANIENYLESQNVGRRLLKRTGTAADEFPLHQSTPVTGVIKYRSGKSIALGWKNETDAIVRLTPADIQQTERSNALKSADVVFVTFEVPAETVAQTIKVATSVRPHPLIVVTPAPPYEGVPIGREILEKIDYLVAQEWEVLKLLPQYETTPEKLPSKEELALYLRQDGVSCVCIVDTSGSLIQSEQAAALKNPSYVLNPRDTAGARDAFAVALVAKVLETGKFDKEAARWAAAAWAEAASTSSEGVPQAMPYAAGINARLNRMRIEFPSND